MVVLSSHSVSIFLIIVLIVTRMTIKTLNLFQSIHFALMMLSTGFLSVVNFDKLNALCIVGVLTFLAITSLSLYVGL